MREIKRLAGMLRPVMVLLSITIGFGAGAGCNPRTLMGKK